MPLGQGTHIQDQYETNSHLSSRTTPPPEPESRTAPGSRKRVPVAVLSPVQLNIQTFVLTRGSARGVESVRLNAVATKETIRAVPIVEMQATKTLVVLCG